MKLLFPSRHAGSISSRSLVYGFPTQHVYYCRVIGLVHSVSRMFISVRPVTLYDLRAKNIMPQRLFAKRLRTGTPSTWVLLPCHSLSRENVVFWKYACINTTCWREDLINAVRAETIIVFQRINVNLIYQTHHCRVPVGLWVLKKRASWWFESKTISPPKAWNKKGLSRMCSRLIRTFVSAIMRESKIEHGGSGAVGPKVVRA